MKAAGHFQFGHWKFVSLLSTLFCKHHCQLSSWVLGSLLQATLSVSAITAQLPCWAQFKITVITILQAMTGNHVGPTTAAASLEEMFSSGGGGGRGGTSKRVTVLLVDEMDLLVTKKQTV